VTTKAEARRCQTYAEAPTYGVKRPRGLGKQLWDATNGKITYATPIAFQYVHDLSDADAINLAKRHIQASKAMIKVCERFLKKVHK
jgi:hypothetical protein